MSWACQPLRNGCISKTPTCWWQRWGSIGGRFRQSVSVWRGADLTGDVVVWREETAVQKRKRKYKTRQHNKQQMCAGEWPCSWQCCDVIWDGAGSNAWTGCRWCDVIWCQEDAWGGGVTGPEPSFILALVFLFISLSHTCTHTNIRSLSHSPLSSLLCQSYLSYQAATHFPSLLNSFLSIQYSPLSHFLSHSCSILLSPVGCESVTQCRAAGMGAVPDQPPMDW